MAASFQPYWTYEDEYVYLFNLPKVGPERLKWSYPIGSIQRSGATVAFASDWSVSSANPMLGMETAITHINPHTNEGGSFLPSEVIDLPEAIEAYNINGAFLNAIDDMTGSIEVGKYADLVVLDANLFEIPVFEISDVSVVATMLEGEVVYGVLE